MQHLRVPNKLYGIVNGQLLCRIVEPVCVLTGIQWGNTADLTLGDFSQKRWP